MKIRVAMIGCGTVGAIHAAQLATHPDVELTGVYSTNSQRASAFASMYNIEKPADSVASAIAKADVAIVCSPTSQHFDQALGCLRTGIHTLVELPACGELREAEELGAAAQKQGVVLGCAHTARYLLPYAKIQAALELGLIGEIQEISYVRYPQIPARSWSDNALLHHSAHVIDLALHWCGKVAAVACTAFPDASSVQSTSLLAKLPGGGPLAVTVSYGAKVPSSRMVVVGTKHTVETDGFSYLRSDMEELQFTGDENAIYEQAIHDQDAQFLDACRKKDSFVPWTETMNLIHAIHQFQELSGL